LFLINWSKVLLLFKWANLWHLHLTSLALDRRMRSMVFAREPRKISFVFDLLFFKLRFLRSYPIIVRDFNSDFFI
jgi:hypothetical protein